MKVDEHMSVHIVELLDVQAWIFTNNLHGPRTPRCRRSHLIKSPLSLALPKFVDSCGISVRVFPPLSDYTSSPTSVSRLVVSKLPLSTIPTAYIYPYRIKDSLRDFPGVFWRPRGEFCLGRRCFTEV